MHGMIVQLPLDAETEISEDKVIEAIDPDKDVDGSVTPRAGWAGVGDCLYVCIDK